MKKISIQFSYFFYHQTNSIRKQRNIKNNFWTAYPLYKEEVLIYFEEDKWVEQYTYRYDKDIGKGVYGDLVYGDDISYDNIYFSTSFIFFKIY